MPTATRIRDHCLAPARAVDAPAAVGGYRRLFPELDPLDCEDGALHALGRPGGACDAAAAAVESGAGQDAEGAAGWPVFGRSWPIMSLPRGLPDSSGRGIGCTGEPG
jgi:hypothetical protein